MSFDAGANGYARGEAVVALHVKRLKDAVRDNDPIRAVIRASCVNSDGKTAGLSQPSSESHAALIRRSHELADARDLSQTAMIECHGTGTQAGDTMEASAVASVFREYGVLNISSAPSGIRPRSMIMVRICMMFLICDASLLLALSELYSCSEDPALSTPTTFCSSCESLFQ
jgi:hypothetical protein